MDYQIVKPWQASQQDSSPWPLLDQEKEILEKVKNRILVILFLLYIRVPG